MKSYPSINGKIVPETKVWTFDKIDGSNIRAEWSDKQGFYKFGSRHLLIDETHQMLGESISLVREKEEQLSSIFSKKNWKRVVAFFEYHGEGSFAGSHEDEEHEVTLIDVNVYKRGMLEPELFVDLFTDVGRATLLHTGVLDEDFVTSVKQGTLKYMSFEGVVCKYVRKNHVRMFKIKNRAWIDKLKVKCVGNDALFRRLR